MDEKTLTTLLGLNMLAPENRESAERLKDILDCFEAETGFDKASVLTAVLKAMDETSENNRSLDLVVYLAEKVLERTLCGELPDET